jgi:hypothetical protein
LEIVESGLSVDQKMRAICAIDRRHLGQPSPWWARLLGVTAAAIRKTLFWKRDRRQAIDADRDRRRG